MSKFKEGDAVRLKDGSAGKVVMVRGPVNDREKEDQVLVDSVKPDGKEVRAWSPVSDVIG